MLLPVVYFLYSYCLTIRKSLFVFSLVLLSAFSYSQEQKVTFHFLKDTVITNYGETFSNRLLIANNTPDALFLIAASADSLALISLPDTLSLRAGEKKELFVKYLATPSLFRLTGNKISIKYRIAGRTGLTQAAFFIHTQTEQPLLLSAVNNMNYLSAQNNEGSVQVRCSNNGYTSLSFKLLLKSYPDGLEITNNNRVVHLQPGDQELLLFNFRNIRAQNLTPDFNLSVQAIDALSGKALTITYTRVLLLTSEKRLPVVNTNAASLINNTAQLSYQSASNGFSYYQLTAGGAVYPSDNGMFRYHLNLNYYNTPFSGIELYDSWVAYKNKHFGIQAGNISENLDYSLFGKGLKASVSLDSSNTISGYYVKNEYLLFSNINQQREGAAVWAGTYAYSGENNNSRFVYLNAKDPLTGIQTNLMNANSELRFRAGQVLALEAGYSHEVLSDDNSLTKKGYAGGIRYQQTAGKWSFISDNYYSSPYYGGLRRGALLLQEHIDYRLKPHQHVFLHYEVINNTPSYLSKYYPAFLDSKTSKYQAGFATGAGHWMITLHPYFYTQALHQNIAATALALQSASSHAAAAVSYSAMKHSFLLTADYGRVASNNPYLLNGNYSVWQGMISYNNRFAGVNAFFQNNPFYLMQEPLPWQQGKFRQYALSPYIHFALLDRKLEGELSDNLSYYSYAQGWSNSVQGKLGFRFKHTWQVTAQALYSTYTQFPDYNFLQTQVSLIKSFKQQTAPGYKRLSIIFFGDKNANGIWDADELPVGNVIASLNESLAESNRKGKIAFANLKPALYKLRLQNGNGWWLLEPWEVMLTHNHTFKIALVKSATLSGKIIAEKNSYLQTLPSLEGITIIAMDRQGNKFTTLTDAEGHFSFNLPVKLFIFSVETQDANLRVSNQQQLINIKEQENPLVIFNLADHSRKIDIKQF
ncbi:hypothetical protein NIASO_14465 [Niabella soli DSM 19437]|uniref:SD-repeat containing protein B domain-containing protein n=1 Tax=Niabella soli DSM 19437 TaxID=929713 RepID=W0F8V6_9BACT|nr:hypothetical protein NIASO_14465 [Niabella soli DSM 19437]